MNKSPDSARCTWLAYVIDSKMPLIASDKEDIVIALTELAGIKLQAEVKAARASVKPEGK